MSAFADMRPERPLCQDYLKIRRFASIAVSLVRFATRIRAPHHGRTRPIRCIGDFPLIDLVTFDIRNCADFPQYTFREPEGTTRDVLAVEAPDTHRRRSLTATQ